MSEAYICVFLAVFLSFYAERYNKASQLQVAGVCRRGLVGTRLTPAKGRAGQPKGDPPIRPRIPRRSCSTGVRPHNGSRSKSRGWVASEPRPRPLPADCHRPHRRQPDARRMHATVDAADVVGAGARAEWGGLSRCSRMM